jgi:hypothetical protein
MHLTIPKADDFDDESPEAVAPVGSPLAPRARSTKRIHLQAMLEAQSAKVLTRDRLQSAVLAARATISVSQLIAGGSVVARRSSHWS